MLRTTTVLHTADTAKALRQRARLTENNLALSILLYAQLLSMSALSLLSIASSASWLSVLSVLPLGGGLYFLAARGAKKHEQTLPRLSAGLFALLFFSDMTLCLLSLTELTCAYVLPHYARLSIALPTAFLIGLALSGKRPGGARRTAAFLCAFFLFSIAVCLLFALPEGNRGFLFPLLGYGGKEALRGGLYMTGGVWSLGALPFFTQMPPAPPLKKQRPYLLPLMSVLLFVLLLLCYACLLPAPLLPGDWGFVLRLQLIMEMSPNTLTWSLMLISRMLLFLTSFAAAGDFCCECLRTALKGKKAPVLPLLLLAVPLALSPLDRLLPLLTLLLPLRCAVSLAAVLYALFARKKEVSA